MLVLSVATHSSAALWVWYKLNKPVKWLLLIPKVTLIPHFLWAPVKGSPRCVELCSFTQAHRRWDFLFRTIFSKGTACPVDLCWEPGSGLSTLCCCWKLSCSDLFMPKIKALWSSLVFKYLWLVCSLTSYHPASKTRISAWVTAGSVLHLGVLEDLCCCCFIKYYQ